MRPAWVGCGVLALACAPGPALDAPVDDESDTPVADDETDGDNETDETEVPLADPCFGEEPRIVVTTVTPPDGLWVLADGHDLMMKRGAAGGWLLPLGVTVANMRQHAKIRIRVTDAASGEALTLFDPSAHNVVLVPAAGPWTDWACVGGWSGLSVYLDMSHALDGPHPTEPWRDFCGRRVRVDVSVTDELDLRTIQAALDLRLQPDPDDGEPCFTE